MVVAVSEVQWQQCRVLTFLALATNLLHCALLSATVNTQMPDLKLSVARTVLLILSLITYLPLLALHLVLARHSSHQLLRKAKLKVSQQCLYFLLFLGFIISSLYSVSSDFHTHISAWTVIVAWLGFFLNLSDLPALSVYVHMFRSVFTEILQFILIVLPIIVGFALSFHVVHRSAQSESPLNWLLRVYSLGVEWESGAGGTATAPGTAHLLFLLLFLTTNLALLGVVVGLAVRRVGTELEAGPARARNTMAAVSRTWQRCYSLLPPRCRPRPAPRAGLLRPGDPVVRAAGAEPGGAPVCTRYTLQPATIAACQAILLARREEEQLQHNSQGETEYDLVSCTRETYILFQSLEGLN